MRRWLWIGASSSTGVVCLASVLIHPYGPLKADVSPQPLLTGASLEPRILATLAKACQNCHSNNTEWPWYSYVAPMSWLIEQDVQGGRSLMNLSRWSEYPDEEKKEILSAMASLVRNRKMPLPKYLLLHPEAKLSDAEVDQLYRWARREARKK